MSALNEEINERRYFEVKEWLAETPEEREYKKKIEKCSLVCYQYNEKLGFDNPYECVKKCSESGFVTIVLKDFDNNVIMQLDVPKIALQAAKLMPSVLIPIRYEYSSYEEREYNIVFDPDVCSNCFLLYVIERRRIGIAQVKENK